MRRRVKAQSTPPKALRSFPPPAAAAEDTSGSAIAVASSPRVRGAGALKSQCWTQAETTTSRSRTGCSSPSARARGFITFSRKAPENGVISVFC
jgi:hypothetical protein